MVPGPGPERRGEAAARRLPGALRGAQRRVNGFARTAALQRLGTENFDLLVVGGGITGAGVALDAAARGLRVALVERSDFASGTSSKSSKLVHGGLRYLQQKEYRLVYENLAERQRLLDNAPHLVQPLPFLIPLFGKQGGVNRAIARAYRSALWLYDATGGVRIGKRHRRISAEEALEHLPTLDADLLAAAFIYYDAQADDARLTLALVRTAVLDHGAVAANYCPVAGLVRADGRVAGARLADGAVVKASAVVNATGVWVDRVRAMDEGRDPEAIRPAKGVHLTVPRSLLPADIAAVLPVPGDRRSIFIVPWDDHVYVGTTDTDYSGDLDDPKVCPDDVGYILSALNQFVTRKVTEADVVGTWAGLRPLVRNERSVRTADLSRRHQVVVSASGLVTITGGKLTTYRKMAEDTVDEVARVLGRRLGRSPTAALKVRGGEGFERFSAKGPASLGLSAEVFEHLANRYGTEARTLGAMVGAEPALAERLVPGLPYLRAEALYGVRYEMAHTLDDVLSRRTRALLLDRDATVAAAGDVARLVAPELGWDEAEVARQVENFTHRAEQDREAAGLPAALPHA
ncbi:MAG: glycerol-3-phosphate dehydrogenase/oxidase [Actinobacteria bacterium]|nr:glycerol-3-phosphate dehydrogenase/oxidase [Actinomycetota bacterium]